MNRADLTWHGEGRPPPQPITPAGWARVIAKGLLVGGVTFGCLGLLIIVRQVERPFHGQARPWTPHITQFVCRTALAIIGIRRRTEGQHDPDAAALVANHSSWLDIFVLNAEARVYFVSKADVAGWPGIGWLARATGTLFISRVARDAGAQAEQVAERLRSGHQLLFFPEGTSTDGRRVLPFRSTLFAPLAGDDTRVQPVTVIYHAPEGADARFYGWWSDMGFGEHLLKMLAAPQHGSVEVVFHPPVSAATRKLMAEETGHIVRDTLLARL